jgi:hypothetical protein
MITNDTLATLHLVLLLNIQLLYIILRWCINTGDFFYDNILTDSKLVTFINGENSPAGLTSYMQVKWRTKNAQIPTTSLSR